MKAALVDSDTARAAGGDTTLAMWISAVAARLAADARVEASLLTGIALVGAMTLRQVGAKRFAHPVEAPGQPLPPDPRAPEAIVRARATDASQGLLGFLRGARARYDVRFDERRRDACFQVIVNQHLTTGAESDTRPYAHTRGYSQVGPIPAQCRTGSCGTCWVGVLGGAEKLSPVDDIERRRLRECGYLDTEEDRPFIRLACMARAGGNVTLVIPPWNGFLTRGGLAAPPGPGVARATARTAHEPRRPSGASSPAPAGATAVGAGLGTPGPARIQALSAPQLKAMMDAGEVFELVDVRSGAERAMARIEGARLLDQAYHDELLSRDPETKLVFQCHHGIRSRNAAEYFRQKGFRQLYNLQGGIDAWSELVDPTVPRY